ncbi:hypothetical protein CFE53_04360 [Methanofervidicoccus sp. A16]|uniref:DUF2341 domain-containing protein n=1 Tax=Methanofervidicoccus sp. A16 TaxID=2607662 RepID=UPI001187B7C3|nr:DUF2341 domain-containing protein [Methanofervidicoccus sp. A16]AXI25403.1 hypothetical protein CFE53_04360 [Methanofervidicoccus sp. A16]
MYTSHTMLILTLLLLLTAALFYNTIDLQKRQVIEEMRATSVDLKSSSVEHVVSSSLSPVFNKVLNNASLKVAMDRTFFNSSEEVVNYLWSNTEDYIRNYLNNVSEYYSDQGYNFTYSFNITNITMIDGFTFRIDYDFSYTLSYNGTINRTDSIESFQYVTVKTILDAYHYLKPTYIMPINISNPNNYDLTDFQVKIILNNSNFNFSIDPNGKGLRFVDEENRHIPYWIEYWNYSNDNISNDKAIIWIKVPELEAGKNTTVYLVSTYPKKRESNGYLVFELFDDFESNDSIGVRWNDLYGDWKYYNFSNNYLLYNDMYNRRVVGCENAPPVARIISFNNVSLKNYIVEVDGWGDNNYKIKNRRRWKPYPAPNIMIGYFANPQYYGFTTTHPDAFYTFDLGGRYRNDDYALYAYFGGKNLYWDDNAQLFPGVMICNEHIYAIRNTADGLYEYDNRIRVNHAYTSSLQKETWYHIKILITEKEVNGNKVKEVSGTYTPLENYIKYNIENPWIISATIYNPYGSHFLLGTSWGDHKKSLYQHIYFDNFRVRKYAPIEPKVYVSGSISRIYPLIYISPSRAYGTHYGEGVSYNPYFVEDPSGEYPSIVDMLAGRDTKEWEYGYGIKLIGFSLPED